MAAFAGVWINEAIRDKLEQDLRLWERFQLYQYLADINASLDCARSNKVSAASLPDRFSDSSAIFARWSWNSYRSWVPSRQQNGELIDMQTLTKRFGGASIDRFEVKAPGAQTGLHDSNIYHNCAEALSPLALAVRLERLDYVALALRENLSCHKSCCERYALCLGCLKGNSEVVASLLNAGIDPNLPGPPSLHVRPLTLAMLRDHRDVVKLLLEKGATVNDDSASYFLLAAKSDDVPLMHLMLKRGLSPDCTIEGEPLIILSARKRYEGATTRLFEAGAYLSTSDCNGMTALHHASVNGHCCFSQWSLWYSSRPPQGGCFSRDPSCRIHSESRADAAYAGMPKRSLASCHSSLGEEGQCACPGPSPTQRCPPRMRK